MDFKQKLQLVLASVMLIASLGFMAFLHVDGRDIPEGALAVASAAFTFIFGAGLFSAKDVVNAANKTTE